MLFNLYINNITDIFDEDCDSVKLDNYSINTLMYADNVILLSTFEKSRQNCLNKLNTYCMKCKLKVNTVKSKVIVFDKTGKLTHLVFKFRNFIIENVRNYTYLGIEFLISGSFTEAKVKLKAKAMKSTFLVSSIIKGTGPG